MNREFSRNETVLSLTCPLVVGNNIVNDYVPRLRVRASNYDELKRSHTVSYCVSTRFLFYTKLRQAIWFVIAPNVMLFYSFNSYICLIFFLISYP